MSRSSGIFTKIWQVLQKSVNRGSQTVQMVGEDHLGNRYFEKSADPSRNRRSARWVEPHDKAQSKNPTFIPDVPIEWEAWLRRRRSNPPTQEEIDRNYAMMLRTQMRAKEHQEKESLSREPGTSNQLYTDTITQDHYASKFPKYEELELRPGQHQAKQDRE